VKTARPPAWPARLGCALLAVLPFIPVLGFDFVWDDHVLIVENDLITGLDLGRLWWMAKSLWMGTWQPLGWLAYALIHAAAGIKPAAFHAAGLAAHAAVAAALCAAAERLLPGRRLAAILAAGLFAVHPLSAATVSWATELPDQLAALFCLLALIAHLDGKKTRAAVLFAVSLGFRWKGIALPFVLLALDRYPLRRKPDIKGKAPLFALAAAALVLNGLAKSFAGYAASLDLGGTARGLLIFLGKLAWPSNLLPAYSLVEPGRSFLLPGWGAMLLCAAIAWAARRSKPAAAALACYALLIAPPLLAGQKGIALAFAQYPYLAAMPLFVLAGAGLAALPRGKGAAAGVLALVVLGAVARRESSWWRSDETLWRRTLAVDPDCRMAYSNLGDALLRQGRAREAFPYIEAQLRYNPDDPSARASMERLRRDYGIIRR
jgi:protein O-mannosyl-transferase